MRTTLFGRLLARLSLAPFTALAAVGLALLLLCPANAAPLEEDIPQSPAPRHAKARPSSLAEAPDETPSGSSTSSEESVSPPERNGTDQSDAAPTTAANAHKYFPYTIRSGDTLQKIADVFGVQVADITRANRHVADYDLVAGDTIRIPNPFVTRESELNAEVERLSIDKQEAERKAEQATNAIASVQSQLESAATSNARYEHDIHLLPWWRMATWVAGIVGVVMFGAMLVALTEWWNLRSRYRAVAEMNDSLRRLDYRYRMVMAKAELRLQELYGRRRRGIEEGQERPQIPEEIELQRLDLQIKGILESYLEGLGPPNNRARRAWWRELIGAVGAPIEARSARR